MATTTRQVTREHKRGSVAPLQVAWLLDGIAVLPTVVLAGMAIRAAVVAGDGGEDGLATYSDTQIMTGAAVIVTALIVWVCAWHVGATVFRYMVARYDQTERHEWEHELRELNAEDLKLSR